MGRGLFAFTLETTRIEILWGLYGMENGLKAGDGEKMEREWKSAWNLTGQRWPKNGLEIGE